MNANVRATGAPKNPHIKTALPGPKSRAMIERDTKVTSPSYPRDYPFVMSHGKGTEAWDVDGNRFLDFAAGIAVCATGHAHPRVVKAVQDAGHEAPAADRRRGDLFQAVGMLDQGHEHLLKLEAETEHQHRACGPVASLRRRAAVHAELRGPAVLQRAAAGERAEE